MPYTSNEIETITKKIHETMNVGNSPSVNVVGIARQLDFHVFEIPFENNKIDGMVVNSESEKSIYVNQTSSSERKRFTISHELGHIILHHENQDEAFREIDFRGNNRTYEPREHEANVFAAALLMPKNISIRVWNATHDVDDFASAFKVSKVAAAIRLQTLGLIQ